MRKRKVARAKDCTLDKVEILDSRSIPDADMRIVLKDLGFSSIDDIYNNAVLAPYNDTLDAMKALKKLSKNLTSWYATTQPAKSQKELEEKKKGTKLESDRQKFTDLVDDLDGHESSLAIVLEDLDDVFDDTEISFASYRSNMGNYVKDLLSLTETPKVHTVYEDKDFQERVQQRRNILQESLDRLEAQLEEVERDFDEVKEKILLYFDRKEGNDGLDPIEEELVAQIRSLKKRRGKSSKKERAIINRKRTELSEKLKEYQQSRSNLDLNDLREEQEDLLAEIKQLNQSIQRDQDELFEGEDQKAARSMAGIQKLADLISSFEEALGGVDSMLSKVLKAEKANKVKKITISYLDAACILTYTESTITAKQTQDFLQYALTGNGCMTRKEWADNNMFGKAYWTKKIKDVVSFYNSKFGDIALISEGIKEHYLAGKMPKDFEKFCKGKF